MEEAITPQSRSHIPTRFSNSSTASEQSKPKHQKQSNSHGGGSITKNNLSNLSFVADGDGYAKAKRDRQSGSGGQTSKNIYNKTEFSNEDNFTSAGFMVSQSNLLIL